MIRAAATMLLLSLFGTPPAQEIRVEVLDKLKAATVFVKASDGVGSGFLFLKRGTTGYIMTCEHVVAGNASVRVVFSSGTPQEKTYEAKVVATDPSRDIACLIVRDVPALPAVLDLGRKTEVRETETVFAAGFPFGGLLSANSRNPEISVSKSSVSSIRRDDARNVALVQISGEVNPGNSGGPLVGVDGRVIGVIALKLMGTQTAFAVPPEEIQGFLKGRVKSSTFRQLEADGTKAKYEVSLALVDPLATLKGAGIAYVDADQIKEDSKPEKDGTWKKAHPSMKTLDFTIDEDHAKKTLDFTKQGSDDSIAIVFQCFHLRADGVRVWTEPATQEIAFSKSSGVARSPRRGPAPPSNPPPKQPPPKDDPPEPPPAPEPPAGPMVELALPEKPVFSAELKLTAVFGALCLAPDGSALYALDLSEAQIYKLDPETLEIKARVDVLESTVTMTMTPDGKTLYTGGRMGGVRQDRGGKDVSGGSIQVVSTSTFKVTDTVQVKSGIVDLVATDKGLLAATNQAQWGGLTIIDVAQKSESEVRMVYGGAVIRLHRDQRRVYLGDTGLSPADFRCTPLRRTNGDYQPYDSPYHGDYPLGGYFELTPDGKFLVAGTGSILRLGRTRESDLRYVNKIDPFQTAIMGSGCSTLFTASADGFLKSFAIESFELRKSVQLGFRCERGAVAVGRKKLYGIFSEIPDERRAQNRGADSRQLRAGKIASLSLEGK